MERLVTRTNLRTTQVKPAESTVLTLRVLRSERISPNFVWATVGGGDIDRFGCMGFDQWFRLFIPVAAGSLERLPAKLDTVAHVKFMTISKATRPILRNYSVRAYRPTGPDGPELDIDLCCTAIRATAPPARRRAGRNRAPRATRSSSWTRGSGFNPGPATDRLLLVADETGLPAVAGILGSLDADANGTAIVEIPDSTDAQPITGPAGVELRWVVRQDPHAAPRRGGRPCGRRRAKASPPGCSGWAVGESHLPTTMHRHWVDRGLPKSSIMFCGYWKLPRGQRD